MSEKLDYHDDIDPTSLKQYPIILIGMGLTAYGAQYDVPMALFGGISILYLENKLEFMETRRKIYRVLKKRGN